MRGEGIRRVSAAPRPILVALALLTAMAVFAGPALATTGPTNIKRRPYFLIARTAINPYLGRYRTGPQKPTSKLIQSDMLITIDTRGFAEGGIEFIGYDAQGNEQSELLALYDFHIVGGNVVANMVSNLGNPIYGHITFHRLGATRNLVVTVRPTVYAGAAPVVYRYLGGGVAAHVAKKHAA